MNSLKIGMVMDSIETIKPYKDTSFAILLEAQRLGHKLFYMNPNSIYLQDGVPWATQNKIKVCDNNSLDNNSFYELEPSLEQTLSNLDILFIRQDPPFNQDYLYSTHLLELAEKQGVLVVNKPQSLRDANEKLFCSWFPQCIPPTLVSANMDKIKLFIESNLDVILKPLDAMGGSSIFRVKRDDPNKNVILETMTGFGKHHIMAQLYLPEIVHGDKRILLINGEPIPYVLARIPSSGETRANLAAGGKGVGQAISKRDIWLCKQIASKLKEKNLHFVGVDVIGDYITEINVTSPTCVRELDSQFNLNIAGELFKHLHNVLECKN